MSRLFCFGFGYSARRLAIKLKAEGWQIFATVRSEEKCRALKAEDIDSQIFDGSAKLESLDNLKNATHVLVSTPPGVSGDPVYNLHCHDLTGMVDLAWIGYLSATSVYGDTGGLKVDETAILGAETVRGKRRIQSEKAWLEGSLEFGLPVHIFRLAGIYGPGRNAIEQLRLGRARRVIKEGHLFSRIHVEDIAGILKRSIARSRIGAIYNVCDDEPAMSSDVIEFAAQLIGVKAPPSIPFTEGSLSEMARSFYSENRQIDNSLIKSELGVKLKYPNYRDGLRAIIGETSSP
jgi:hypothetical protein